MYQVDTTGQSPEDVYEKGGGTYEQGKKGTARPRKGRKSGENVKRLVRQIKRFRGEIRDNEEKSVKEVP